MKLFTHFKDKSSKMGIKIKQAGALGIYTQSYMATVTYKNFKRKKKQYCTYIELHSYIHIQKLLYAKEGMIQQIFLD